MGMVLLERHIHDGNWLHGVAWWGRGFEMHDIALDDESLLGGMWNGAFGGGGCGCGCDTRIMPALAYGGVVMDVRS